MFTCYKKYFKYLRFHRYCNNDNLVQNNIINLKKNPLYFNQIPVMNHEKVMKLMPKYFFTIHSLEQLTHVKMNTNLFKTHFGHIPLYYMENNKNHVITWCPLKLLHTDEWVDCKVIYTTSLEGQDDILIKLNSIDTKSYTIRYINMINYFYLCDL